MFSHSTSGSSPRVAEAIVGRSLTTTNEGPVLRYRYTGQPLGGTDSSVAECQYHVKARVAHSSESPVSM